MRLYLGGVLTTITDPGDDNNYGSSVLNDVACLQARSGCPAPPPRSFRSPLRA